MKTARGNMLRTTLYDEDIKLNRFNDTEILPSFWNYFAKLFPASVRVLDSADSGGVDGNRTGTGGGNDTPCSSDTDPLTLRIDTDTG